MNKNFHSKTTNYNFQTKAIDFLKNLEYGGIFYEQGLGKTKIAIELILNWLKKKEIDLVIVVTKKGLVKNWEDEVSIHSSISFEIIQQNRKVTSALFMSGINLLLTNYEVIGSQYKKLIALSGIKRLAIILDESAKIKNPHSKLTKIFFNLTDCFKKRFILTGTPSANRPFDIWSQIKFLDKGKALNIPFDLLVEKCDLKNSLITDEEGQKEFSDSLSEIFKKIKKFCVRETKELNLQELNKKKYINIFCSWETHQKTLYNKFREELKIHVKKNNTLIQDGSGNILKRILRLMQICSNPHLVDQNYIYKTDKIIKLEELIHKILLNEEKCIIWSSYVENINYLFLHFEELGAVKVHGKLSIKKRNENINSFKKNKSTKILLATPQSCKEGLTLTTANHCIFFDRTLSLDDYLQAQDRIHRISQKKQCYIYNLIIKDSIDVWVDKLIEAKNISSKMLIGDINKKTFKDSINYEFGSIIKEILDDTKKINN